MPRPGIGIGPILALYHLLLNAADTSQRYLRQKKEKKEYICLNTVIVVTEIVSFKSTLVVSVLCISDYSRVNKPTGMGLKKIRIEHSVILLDIILCAALIFIFSILNEFTNLKYCQKCIPRNEFCWPEAELHCVCFEST